MGLCNNCGGDTDCTHKPELSAELARQASRIAALEGALRELHDYLREHGSAKDTLAMLTRSHAALGKAVGK